MSTGPIISPYYAVATPWPYIKGPNYTRPVFGENTRYGAFQTQPIIRMPLLGFGAIKRGGHAKALLQQRAFRGFGDPVPATPAPADPTAALPSSPPAAPPDPASACAEVKGAGTTVYNECVAYKTALYEAIASPDTAAAAAMVAATNAADTKCGGISDSNAWATCFYDALTPWYKKPLYLGGAIIGGCVVLGVLTRLIRSQ